MGFRWCLLVFCLIEVMCLCVSNSTQEKNCDSKSSFWDTELSQTLDATCEHLSYNKQYCRIGEENKIECLRQRALMHDMDSCNCYKPHANYASCLYLEVCIFTDAEFMCDKNYVCSVNESNHVNCTSEGLPPFSSHCYRSLIHCPSDKHCMLGEGLENQFLDIFTEHCMKDYPDLLEKNQTIYYTDQIHFDNESWGFGNITAIRLAEGDESNKCKISDPSYVTTDMVDTPLWKYIIPTLIIFITIVLMTYGIWKLKRYELEKDKILEAKMKQIIDRIIADVEGAADLGTTPDTREEPEPIPPEGIALPQQTISTGEEPVDSYSSPGYERLRQGNVTGQAEQDQMHSHDNPNYSGTSISLTNSTYSEQHVPWNNGMHSESGWSEGDSVFRRESDTESAYSDKFSMDDSVGALLPPHNSIEMRKLDPISEMLSGQDEGAGRSGFTEVSNFIHNTQQEQSLGQDEGNENNDPIRKLFLDAKQMDNPTYLS